VGYVSDLCGSLPLASLVGPSRVVLMPGPNLVNPRSFRDSFSGSRDTLPTSAQLSVLTPLC
jgi:hypothetical protein